MTDSPASQGHNSPQNGSPGYRGTARSGPRSKSGCYTCREKKVKCDEKRPQCLRCVRLSRTCDYEPRERKKHTSRRAKKLDVESLPLASGPTETNLPAERHESSALTPVVLETVQALQVTKNSKRHSQHCIPLVPLSPPRVSAACSLILSPEDHIAIHHFRTTFSTNQHTKNPQFSVLSIIFHLAAESPMLMHMVVALAGREATYFKFGDDENGRELESSITHYTLAMQAMAKAVDGTDPPDLGIVLAALWLMIIYEQKYGDSDGLANHLKGAASILRQRCRPLVDDSYTSKELSISDEKEYNDERSKIAAMFAARMLVWLSAVDAGAASYGIGGHVNSSIVELIACCAESDNASPLNGFSVIHRHSRPLFRMMWGEAYPQSELLDDLQNQEVYSLFGECFQLRFMVARLASLFHEDPAAAETRSKSVDQTLQQVGEKYSELLASSELLRFEDNSGQRLVSNIISIVPHYHAATLEFFRVVRPGKPLNERQRLALRSIISMAFRGYKHDGDRAMLRIPWPLFVAAIETDDPVHREWIFNRFQNIGRYGRNYRKALKVLEAVIKEQEKSGDAVNILQLLESGAYDRFVI